MTKADRIVDRIVATVFLLGFGGLIGAAFVRDAQLEERAVFESRAEILTESLHNSNRRMGALKDSVFLGDVSGFNVRCYFVPEGIER
jgi:hypothetical protein